MDVVVTKERYEKASGSKKGLTHAEIVEIYKARVTYAEGSEQVTETFVANALYVYNRVLKDPEVQANIYEMDAAYGERSAWAQVCCMHKAAFLCKTMEEVRWVFNHVCDMFTRRLLLPGDVTESVLDGSRSGGKGLIHLCKAKMELLKYTTGEYMDKHGFGSASRYAVTTTIPDHNRHG